MTTGILKITGALSSCRGPHKKENMKKLIIIGALLIGLSLQGLAQTDVISPGMSGVQTRNALNTAFSEVLGVVDTVNETVRIGGVQITANAAEVNILDNALVNVTELNRLVGIPDNIVTLLAGKENSLGNPGTSGYVLSSTSGGTRSWITPGGGAVYPEGTGIPFVNAGDSWGTTVTTVSQTELEYIDGLDGTAASRQNIRDSLLQALAGAEEVIAQKDSTGNAVGNYMTRKGVVDAIAAAGGGEGDKRDELMLYHIAMGNSVIALPVAATTVQSSSYTMIDQNTFFVAFILHEATTITGIAFGCAQVGDFTAADFNGVALYSVSENTATQVAISANDGNIWKGTLYSKVSVPFTSTYSAAAGVYYVGIMYNQSAQTTAPMLYCSADIGTANYNVDRLNRRISAMSNRIVFAATESISGLGFTAKVPYIWLY